MEEWANKSYSELQAEASKLRAIMMMGMEDQLVCDTLVLYHFIVIIECKVLKYLKPTTLILMLHFCHYI